MKKKSAGILLYRFRNEDLEVLLAHPGGPLWAKKDAGAWSIPKGEIEEGEDPLQAARREFEEETGLPVAGAFIELRPVKQPGGKTVMSWALQKDGDAAVMKSNTFTMEWPPKSGRRQEFPEIDRAGWFSLAEAKVKISKGQLPILEDLQSMLGA